MDPATNMTADWIERQWKANPCKKLENGDVRTGPVRLSFPFPYEAPPARNGIEGKIGSTLLFPVGADLSVLMKEAGDVARHKWPELGTPKGPKLKTPFLKQDEDAERYIGYIPGGILIRANANQAVPVVDQRLAPVIDRSKCYPGVWAIVTLRAFAYDKGVNKGVSFGLQAVMIVADDQNIGGTGAANPNQAFAGVSIEGGDINADAAFGTAEKASAGEVDIFS